MSAIDDIGNSSDEELLQLARSGNNYITPIPDLQRLTIVVAEMLRRAKDATISLEETTKHLADASTRLTKRMWWASLLVAAAGFVLAFVQFYVTLKR